MAGIYNYAQLNIAVIQQILLQHNSMEETPNKNIQEKQPEDTGVKPGEESHYEAEDSYDKPHTSDETLDQLEEEIKHLGERLAEISQEKGKFQAGSAEFDRLEDERRVLRKEIIDLDYHHKLTMIARRKEKQAKQSEQHEAEREKAKQEESIARAEAEGKVQEGEGKVQEGEAEKKQTAERNLAEERYNGRIREIETELALSRLRRSRQIQLQADLIAIRSLSPYYWWRYYDRPYYYPLYSDPLYYSYPYPYSSVYAYPRYYPFGLYI